MGVLRADRTEVLQEMLSPRHVSITQPPLGPCVPREYSARPGPGRLQDGQQEHGPGAALGRRCAQRTCSEHPASACTARWWALLAAGGSGPARNHRPPLPARSNAPRLVLVQFLVGASTWKNHLQSTWGWNNISQSLFPRQKEKRASWEGKRGGAWH